MYVVTLDSDSGSLLQLKMRATRMCRFQIKRASSADAVWIAGILNREGHTLGTRVEKDEAEMLTLHWK
jgi:poly-gamma-glutamate synthesis protein (capsule biosynthesis protein)